MNNKHRILSKYAEISMPWQEPSDWRDKIAPGAKAQRQDAWNMGAAAGGATGAILGAGTGLGLGYAAGASPAGRLTATLVLAALMGGAGALGAGGFAREVVREGQYAK